MQVGVKSSGWSVVHIVNVTSDDQPLTEINQKQRAA